MRIGAILSPIRDAGDAVEAARAADGTGLDAVGLWDHYRSPRSEWGYVAGWSMLAAMAAATELDDVISTTAPEAAPRVVVGVGGSRRTLDWAGEIADELNVHAGADLIEAAAAAGRADGGRPSVSVFLWWEWDKWPDDPAGELHTLQERGASRALASMGAELPIMPERITSLAAATDPA